MFFNPDLRCAHRLTVYQGLMISSNIAVSPSSSKIIADFWALNVDKASSFTAKKYRESIGHSRLQVSITPCEQNLHKANFETHWLFSPGLETKLAYCKMTLPWYLVMFGMSPRFRVHGFVFSCNFLTCTPALNFNQLAQIKVSAIFSETSSNAPTPSPMRCLMTCAWRATAETHQMQDDLVYLVGTEVVFWPDRMKQLCKMTQLLYVF